MNWMVSPSPCSAYSRMVLPCSGLPSQRGCANYTRHFLGLPATFVFLPPLRIIAVAQQRQPQVLVRVRVILLEPQRLPIIGAASPSRSCLTSTMAKLLYASAYSGRNRSAASDAPLGPCVLAGARRCPSCCALSIIGPQLQGPAIMHHRLIDLALLHQHHRQIILRLRGIGLGLQDLLVRGRRFRQQPLVREGHAQVIVPSMWSGLTHSALRNCTNASSMLPSGAASRRGCYRHRPNPA